MNGFVENEREKPLKKINSNDVLVSDSRLIKNDIDRILINLQKTVEIKSKRSGAKPSIRISSADQLEIIPNTSLFMAVFGIDKNNSEQSKSLTQWIKYTVEKIYNSDFIGCLQDFYDVLDESGYREDQDPYYQDQKWDIKEIKFFEITEAFPRIVASKIPTSLLNVNYSIDMNAVSPFEISKEKLLEFLNAAKS